MQDFNEYIKNGKKAEDKSGNGNILEMVQNIAKKYDGKSESELFSAVINEAKKRKATGTLSNSEIDKFVATLSPFLDDKKKKILNKIAEKIKEI